MTTGSSGVPCALVISEIIIHQDAEGRFFLNDLHKAAGGELRHRPKFWLENQQTQELIAELQREAADDGIPSSEQIQSLRIYKGGNGPQGTAVVKELVYSYAMWISPAFHLKVIRGYDAMVTQARPEPTAVGESGPVSRLDWDEFDRLQRRDPSGRLGRVYLVEQGVTQNYLEAQLARAPIFGAGPGSPTDPCAEPAPRPSSGQGRLRPSSASNAAPLDYLAATLPGAADREDRRFWFLLPASFEAACGDYAARATARHLRDHGMLQTDGKHFTTRRVMPELGRVRVYVVDKRLAGRVGGRIEGGAP